MKPCHLACLTCGFEVNIKRKLCPNCGCNPKEDPALRAARTAADKEREAQAQSVAQRTETAESVLPSTASLAADPELPIPAPQAPPPDTSTVAAVQSNIAARQAAAQANRNRMVYVVDRDFVGYLGNVSVSCRAGQILTDEQVAMKLREQGLPVSYCSLDNMMVCPHCSKAIAVPESKRRAG